MTNVSSLTFGERVRLARRFGLSGLLDLPKDRMERLAHTALANPRDWLVNYALADLYVKLFRWADAVRVLRRCNELRPHDLRSSFGLGATLWGIVVRSLALEQHGYWATTAFPDAVEAAGVLEDSGLTKESAANEARLWFLRALDLHPDPIGRKQIEESISNLTRFLDSRTPARVERRPRRTKTDRA